MATCQILATERQEVIIEVVLPRVPSHEAFKQRCSVKTFLETIETDDNRTNGKFGKVKRPANGFLSFRNYLQERREEIKKEIRDANAGTTIQPIVPLSDDSNAERAKFLWASLPSDVQDQWKLLKTWGQEYINSIYPNYQYSPVSWYIVNLATLQPVSQDVSSMIYEQAKARVARIDKERKLKRPITNYESTSANVRSGSDNFVLGSAPDVPLPSLKRKKSMANTMSTQPSQKKQNVLRNNKNATPRLTGISPSRAGGSPPQCIAVPHVQERNLKPALTSAYRQPYVYTGPDPSATSSLSRQKVDLLRTMPNNRCTTDPHEPHLAMSNGLDFGSTHSGNQLPFVSTPPKVSSSRSSLPVYQNLGLNPYRSSFEHLTFDDTDLGTQLSSSTGPYQQVHYDYNNMTDPSAPGFSTFPYDPNAKFLGSPQPFTYSPGSGHATSSSFAGPLDPTLSRFQQTDLGFEQYLSSITAAPHSSLPIHSANASGSEPAQVNQVVDNFGLGLLDSGYLHQDSRYLADPTLMVGGESARNDAALEAELEAIRLQYPGPFAELDFSAQVNHRYDDDDFLELKLVDEVGVL